MATVTLTQQNFQQVVSANHIVLVDWWAGWCGPCRHFAPVYEASSELHPEIVHGKVDTEAETALTASAQVDRFPTLMAFREGLLVFNQAGFLPAADLEEVVQQVRWLDMDEVRRQMTGLLQAEAQGQPAAPSAPPRTAGPAHGPARYGWPGL
ncbi:thiol reductase thioredoxin [Nocardia puris]|uniref:Thioredoxin 1 n=1 Tax=Nocardia puris TaxID=208602 RepID=A0A366DUZ1_9NOCA|nr:thiol reductase thioredoxin [Nocardia puris]MBF6367388.1 thiol reductase thioredoxin [Nocardia puris]MBF6457573.1 thiol reductase thioredoxin [Nocardia puris]RBO93735.1 thioredoxin 1 [Nocardia puris]